MADFKVGDVVRLKSGGPKMTVEKLGSTKTGITCIWFHEAEPMSAVFPAEALDRVKKTPEKKTPRRARRRLPLDAVD